MALSTQKMNGLLSSLACGYSDSLRSVDSNNSSISYLGEVHSNPTFDSTEHSKESSNERHEYESIVNRPAVGPRRKINFIYEEARPSLSLPLRTRQTTESDRSSRGSSTSSSDSVSKKGDVTPISKTALFTILVTILAISVAALALVILIITGPLGPKCGCAERGTARPPRADASSVSVQSLLRKIQDLERSVKSLQDIKTEMENRQSATTSLVRKLENQAKSLQKQFSKQAKLLSETASEIKVSNNELTSKVNELRQNHSQTIRISDCMIANVTQLQSSVRELTLSNGNMSTRTRSLEQRYAHVITVIKRLTEVNEAHNATYEAIRLSFMNLKDSIVRVNTTLRNEKLGSACEHKFIKGTPVSSGGEASVSYTQPADKRVAGVECSTDYAQEFKLDNSPQKGLYQCTCRGVAQSAANINPSVIHCYIHLWECPIHT